jgi:hypothetical protein
MEKIETDVAMPNKTNACGGKHNRARDEIRAIRAFIDDLSVILVLESTHHRQLQQQVGHNAPPT